MMILAPGQLLAEELKIREMTQTDLAWIMGRPLKLINKIVNGKKRITVQTAKQLEAGLLNGPSAGFWLRLDNAFRLAKLEGAYWFSPMEMP
jgi:HTH-type transcriptional regulator/antitoxin HigA